MTIRNLEYAVSPKSVVVVGGGFEGEIWPVNPKHAQVVGHRCYGRVADLPGVPDLAVIVTPPET
ncbi:MAG: hypothetical protein E5V99_26230, partial [Mesorhizobium sp.]